MRLLVANAVVGIKLYALGIIAVTAIAVHLTGANMVAEDVAFLIPAAACCTLNQVGF